MGKIVLLDENTSNKIAAGEVVERPASVVKELIENSIDAGASSITVEIKKGGVSYIKISDNGSGIDEDDVEIAFERHATSKIRNADDLESITTMGFRGEALASIASVSRVEVTSRVQKNPHGIYLNIEGGKLIDVRQTGCPIGTTFIIRDLFYNTPARFKFLKKDATEAGYISDIISRIALGNPHISLQLINNGSTILHTPGNNDLLSTVFSVYGKETAKSVLEMNYSDNKVKIMGYAGKAEIARSNRNQQSLFINGRYIRSKVVTAAIDEAYKTFLMKNKFPFVVIKMEINPLFIDINVHPTKMEVRFSNEQEIFGSVYHAVTNALLAKSPLSANYEVKKDKTAYRFEPSAFKKQEYVQQNLKVNSGFVAKPPLEKVKENSSSIFSDIQSKKEPDIILHDPIVHYPESPATDIKAPGFSVKETVSPPSDILKPVIDSNESIPVTGKEVSEGTLDRDPANPIDQQDVRRNFAQDVQVTGTGPSIESTCSENDERKNILLESRIIGQAFSTYILLQHEGELLLIDQHAAHERIMYEQIKGRFQDNESISQMLLTPVVLELTYQELKRVEDEKSFFNKLGFIYEIFGNNSVILRSVPLIMDNASIKETFLQILDYVSKAVKSDYEKVADEVLYTMACKAAIKANKKLDELEIKNILKELSVLPNPYTCPHGRPTITKITKYELEKKFKRII